MITTSMLRQQAWMADDDEFHYIFKNSQRVLGLNAQYENHPYVEEFSKQCNVMFIYGTYVLKGEADSKFSLGDIWNILQEDHLPSNSFCRQMRTWNYIQKTSDLPLNTKIIRQTHKIMIRQASRWTQKTHGKGCRGITCHRGDCCWCYLKFSWKGRWICG